jgi:endonuclease YncB( thermonuclease family)
LGLDKLIILLFIAFFNVSYTNAPLYTVKYVYDGDTILLHNGEKVRYLEIDAPEMGFEGKIKEFMADKARHYNHLLVCRKKIRLEFGQYKRDSYGRLLAFVYLERGDMVNGLLVKHGLARVRVDDVKTRYFDQLLGHQRHAIKRRLGIWEKGPEDPEPYYIGNSKSLRFHRPECIYAKKISAKNRCRFMDYNQAAWEGLSPCKRCRP